MTIPATQSAIRIHKTGGPEVVQFESGLPIPAISDTQILINVKYGGINFIETYFRSGLYPSQLPRTLGGEGSGVVAKVGSKVTAFAVGDRVGFIGPGAYSEYVALEEQSNVVKLPEGVTLQDASAGLIQTLTALSLVLESHEVKKGQTVLVHAAAGGTGSQIVQLAKQAGAIVIGTTSTPEKAALAKASGADHVILYKDEDIVKRVKEITNDVGVDVVYDGVGKSTFETSLEVVKRKGSMISFGNASGAVPPVPLFKLSGKSIRLLRPTLFSYIVTREEWKTYTDRFFELIKDNKIKITVSKTYPLKDANQGLIDLESGKTTGKLLVEV